MHVLPGPTRSNQVLAWSPDGRFVAAGGTGDGVMVWDLVEGTPGRRVLRAGHGGRLIQFCPRTGWLYAGFQSNGFLYWNPEADEERRVPWEVEYTSCNGLAVSADGRTVVLDRNRQTIGYAVADDGTLTRAWARPDDAWISGFAFRSGNGELFGPYRDANIYPRDHFTWMIAGSGEMVGSFPLISSGTVTKWVLAPDGERVAWLTDYALYLQRLDDTSPRTLVAVVGESRRNLAWSPDGRTLAIGVGPTVRLLDADTLAEVRAFDWGMGNVRGIAFSPDGLRAAVSGDAGKGWVTVFDLE